MSAPASKTFYIGRTSDGLSHYELITTIQKVVELLGDQFDSEDAAVTKIMADNGGKDVDIFRITIEATEA